jgi:signal transduction histidine kinase
MRNRLRAIQAKHPADLFETASASVRKNAEAFVDLANILINASQHELSGAFGYVREIIDEINKVKKYPSIAFLSKDEADSVREFEFTKRKLYRWGNLITKLWELQNVCQGHKYGNRLEHLTPQEIEKLRLDFIKEEHKITFQNVDKNALRNAILQKSREIRPLLEYFKKMLEEHAEILNGNRHFKEEYSKRVAGLGFGIQLMEFLEGALIGNFEFQELLSRRTAYANEKNLIDTHCVMSDVDYAQNSLDISWKKTKSRREDNGVQVLTNKLFDLLIATNILANAKRAAEQKGVELDMTIFIHREGDKMLFEFKDNGCGMAPEIIEKLNRGEQITTKTEEGKHGLGFWYCKELAKRMGGDLYIKKSIVGVGSTVVWELKVVNQPPANG